MENGPGNSLPFRFENLCFRLVQKHLGVDGGIIERPGHDADFVVSSKERVVVEAKLYRTFRLPADSLHRSITGLQQAAVKFDASRLILMVSAVVEPAQQRFAQTTAGRVTRNYGVAANVQRRL